MEAYALFIKAHEKYDHLVELEPETISSMMNYSAHDVEKVLACENVFYNFSAFEHYHIFEKTALLLNDRVVDFEHSQELTPCELEWAVGNMRLIDPLHPFSNEVLSYIAVMLHEDGMFIPSPIIAAEKSITGIGVQHFLLELNSDGLPHPQASKEIMDNITNYYSTKMHQLLEDIKDI